MNLSEIKNIAEEIATKYNPEGLSPFPFEKILEDKKNLKILISEKLASNISGATLYDDKGNLFIIVINKDKPKNRQYFTIAHELGHYFLHKDIILEKKIIIDSENNLDSDTSPILFRDDTVSGTSLEIEANNFAAILIMPSELVMKAWRVLNSVEECAKVFNVSIAAMSIRLERLGLIN